MIIRDPSEFDASGQKVCLAIGVFDGVHLGHQQVIRQTLSDAQHQGGIPVVITFDRHPNSIVAKERTPPLIYSLEQKLRVITSVGAQAIYLIRFDRAFSEQPGETFVRGLAQSFGHIQSICVGSNFTFGYKRSGDVPLLRTLGRELKFTVHSLAAVSLDGKVVSSTRIREAIRNGRLDAASQLLGRAYSVAGPVVQGDQVGRQMGFPTANLDVTGLVLPPDGVYAVHVRSQGQSFRGVLNIGHRPTLQTPKPQQRFEVHLLDFQGDLYGQEIEIAYVERLRDEHKFPSLEALKEQIARDIASARALFE